MTEDEMVGWHCRLNGHKFVQSLGDEEGRGSLAGLQSMWSKRVRHNISVRQELDDFSFTFHLCML